VGYELFLLAVPEGADVEETGEALLVRLTRGHERTRLSTPGRGRAETLAAKLSAAEKDLKPAPEGGESLAGTLELRARSGLQVAIADRFARFLVPFAHHGESAAVAFHQLFTLLGVAAEATGWRPYDPQEGEAVRIDDASCDSALEIYLSVMDQLRPAGPAGAVPA
jgi:hypothetical protein